MNYPITIAFFAAQIVNIYATVVISRQHRRSWTSRLITILCAVIGLFSIALMAAIWPDSMGYSLRLFLTRLVAVFGSMISPVMLLLALTYPGYELRPRPRYLWPVIGATVLTVAVSMTSLIYSSFTVTKGQLAPVLGPGVPFWGAWMSIQAIAIFVINIRRFMSAPLAEKSYQLQFLIGTAVTLSMSMTASLFSTIIILDSSSVAIGPLFFTFFFVVMAVSLGKSQPTPVAADSKAKAKTPS